MKILFEIFDIEPILTLEIQGIFLSVSRMTLRSQKGGESSTDIIYEWSLLKYCCCYFSTESKFLKHSKPRSVYILYEESWDSDRWITPKNFWIHHSIETFVQICFWKKSLNKMKKKRTKWNFPFRIK